MAKASGKTAFDRYDGQFASALRAFMERHPDTGKQTTQKELANYLGVRPQTVSLYCTGESLPDCERLLQIAEYFNVTTDFLMTGRRVENKPVREILGLSESTVQNMKLVRDGYFEDTPEMLPMLDSLLGDKDFYLALENAGRWFQRKASVDDGEYQEYCEWKAAQYMQSYLMAFMQGNFPAIYAQKRGQDE